MDHREAIGVGRDAVRTSNGYHQEWDSIVKDPSVKHQRQQRMTWYEQNRSVFGNFMGSIDSFPMFPLIIFELF